jgi:outer membrane biosynthesis protein TonB
MHNWLGAILACVILSVVVNAHAAELPPVPENPLQAQTALFFNPKTRCPDLRITDAGTVAVVVFWLPRSGGVPAHVSIKSSSGSDALDSATISCVSKLRFSAVTTPGAGDPIDSWQQIAFTWASRASEPIEDAPAEMAANAKQDDPGGRAKTVTVHVCVDEAGKLKEDPTIVHSSGMASFDQAAMRIAASGSAYYRPDTSPNRPPASGCAQLMIKFDMK